MRRRPRATPPAAPGCGCHVCRPERRYDPQDQACLDAVVQHGWQVLLVSDDAACHACEHDHGETVSDPGPPFAYTVGLGHTLDHPELLVSGLPVRLAHHVLNEVAGRVAAGRRLAPGDVLEGVLGGVPVVWSRPASWRCRTRSPGRAGSTAVPPRPW